MRETVVVNHVESYAGPVKILHTLPIVPGWGLGWDLIKIHSMQVCYDIKYVYAIHRPTFEKNFGSRRSMSASSSSVSSPSIYPSPRSLLDLLSSPFPIS